MSRNTILAIPLFVAAVSWLLFQAMESGTSIVLTPAQLLERAHDGELNRVRLGGKVSEAELEYALQPRLVLRFRVEDAAVPQKSIAVVYNGVKPDMFGAGRNVLIDGDFRAGVLHASKLMTQCPSKYEPPAGAGGAAARNE